MASHVEHYPAAYVTKQQDPAAGVLRKLGSTSATTTATTRSMTVVE